MPDEQVTGLNGRRILVTRPRSPEERLPELLARRGAMPVVVPAIAVVPPTSWYALDQALARIDQYTWLVATSATAVNAIAERMVKLEMGASRLARLQTAAVGPATAAALARLTSTAPFVAATHTATALATVLPMSAGDRVLFPCGDLARDALAATLRQRGALVDAIVVYRTVPAPELEQLVDHVACRRADGVIFASPSAVDVTMAALENAGNSLATTEGRVAFFCLGPVTADALRGHGVEPDLVGTARLEAFVDLIDHWYHDSVAV